MIEPIIFKLDDKERTAFERISYEIKVLKSMIAFFVELCDAQSKKEMLDTYIQNYKKQLEQDELELEILTNEIRDSYFPLGFEDQREKLMYTIDFQKGEISYYEKR